MANPLRSATIYPSIAAIEASRGPELEQYRIPLDRPYLYRWVIGNVDTVDHADTLGHTGGVIGRWKAVAPVGGSPEADRGGLLADTDETLTWTPSSAWRELPANTLTQARTKTLSVVGMESGDVWEFTRLDATPWPLALVNGGPAGGTLMTMPASSHFFATLYFDGTNLRLRRAGVMGPVF